ncbi:MAG TPA: hypothetical protein VLL54_15420 [Pyrinomonadaceae bacterium]|nr:hypothetical protein [Pyrinomonadaceae bacterium]
MESSIRSMEVRLQRLEHRTFDAKPIAEQVLREIVEMRHGLIKRLDRLLTSRVVYDGSDADAE